MHGRDVYIKEIEDKSPLNLMKEINNQKRRMDEIKHKIIFEQNSIEEKEAELKKKRFLEEFFKEGPTEQSRFSLFSSNRF